MTKFFVKKPKILLAHLNAMASGLESLHKVLKDEKRRKIIGLLNEQGSLSYTQLMNTLGISTGKLNYHLKILNEFIMKQEDGTYVLTEKGKLAVNLMQQFGERKSQSQIDAPFPKGYMIIVSLFSIATLGLNFAFYLTGTIKLNEFILYLGTTVLAIVFLVAAERARVKRSEWSPQRQMLGAKISIMFAAGFAGAVICFFAGGFLLFGGLRAAGIIIRVSSFDAFIVYSNVFGAIVGAFVGYIIYKRSKYSKMRYYNPFAE